MVGKVRLDSPRGLLRCAVAVEGQDVRFLDLDLRGARPFVPGRPAAARVHAAGEGLARVGGPGPSESLRQELAHEFILVRGLLRGPVTVLEGLDARLVPERSEERRVGKECRCRGWADEIRKRERGEGDQEERT